MSVHFHFHFHFHFLSPYNEFAFLEKGARVRNEGWIKKGTIVTPIFLKNSTFIVVLATSIFNYIDSSL